MKTRSIKIWLSTLNLLIFLIAVYAYRWIFFQAFDPVYFKHFYDHSQWSIPNSPRIMGDGELYQYAGYRLLQGESPFIINPEAPPLGKYIYALSIGLFNNAYFLNPLLLASAIALMYVVVKKITSSTNTALMSSLILASQPIIFSQLGDTAFELIHINLLLAYLIVFTSLINSKNKSHQHKYVILVGILLGAFTAVRFGLFSLALIIPSYIWLKKNNQLKLVIPIIITSFITYLCIYIRFFALGNSLVEWFKNQKWILDFYLSSNAPRNPFAFIGTSIFGLLKTESGWQLTPEWTIVWTIGFGLVFWKIKSPTNHKIHFIKAVAITLAILFALIPFGLRYIALLVPIYIVILASQFNRISKKLLIILSIILAIQSFWYLANRPFRDINRINQFLAANRLQDLHQIINGPIGESDHFSYVINNFSYQIQAEDWELEVEPVDQNTFTSQVPVMIHAKYQTPIGLYKTQKLGILKAKHGRWELEWDWEFIAPHFNPSTVAKFTKDKHLGGKLISSDGIVLSEGSVIPYISLIPHQLSDEETLLKHIKTLTKIDPVESRALVHVDYPQTLPKRIGFVAPDYPIDLLNQIATQSGVIITYENGPKARIYPTGIIDQKLVDEVKAIEQNYPNLTHYVQGSIVFINGSNENQIFAPPAQTPTDVVLGKTIDELFGVGTRLLF